MSVSDPKSVADWFWNLAGGPGSFPRELRQAVAFALPLAVVDLPGLDGSKLDRWLTPYGGTRTLCRPGRRLRACLVARRGAGFIFLDGVDPPNERRLSLAHEVAHFIIEYWWPRERALARLGPRVGPALDGHRDYTWGERADALLTGVVLPPLVHLMDRAADGWIKTTEVAEAEHRADRLAWELIAPREAVLHLLSSGASRETCAFLLEHHFGMPAAAANDYARLLISTPTRLPGRSLSLDVELSRLIRNENA